MTIVFFFEQSCLGEKSISGENINDNKSEEKLIVSQSKRGKKLSTKQVLSEFSVSLKNLVNQ